MSKGVKISTNFYTYGPRNEWITAISMEQSSPLATWGETRIPDNLNMTISFWIWPQDYYGQGPNVNGNASNQAWANLIQLSEDGQNDTVIYVDENDESTSSSDATAEIYISRTPSIYIGSNGGYVANQLLNAPYTGMFNFTTALTPQFLTYVFNTEPGDNSTYPNTRASIYFNGVLKETTSYIQSQRATESAKLWIGSSFNPWSDQEGNPPLLKNMTFYNRPITNDEVSVMYERENEGLSWK